MPIGEFAGEAAAPEQDGLVLATPKHVYAFKPADVLPKIEVVPGDEKAGTLPSLVISCPEEKRGIDRFPWDNSDATSLPSVSVPLAKDADCEKLAEAFAEIIDVATPRLGVTATSR